MHAAHRLCRGDPKGATESGFWLADCTIGSPLYLSLSLWQNTTTPVLHLVVVPFHPTLRWVNFFDLCTTRYVSWERSRRSVLSACAALLPPPPSHSSPPSRPLDECGGCACAGAREPYISCPQWRLFMFMFCVLWRGLDCLWRPMWSAPRPSLRRVFPGGARRRFLFPGGRCCFERLVAVVGNPW